MFTRIYDTKANVGQYLLYPTNPILNNCCLKAEKIGDKIMTEFKKMVLRDEKRDISIELIYRFE